MHFKGDLENNANFYNEYKKAWYFATNNLQFIHGNTSNSLIAAFVALRTCTQ